MYCRRIRTLISIMDRDNGDVYIYIRYDMRNVRLGATLLTLGLKLTLRFDQQDGNRGQLPSLRAGGR